ncbi:AAA family ATPase [Thioflexithrix psekupsensis]|uniref:AAA+ ATPase domain-containing protein n=1 Tax=Thioflexithrix psekupsensis TaxID=1570016 RepID=A0A251X722_9GAMM|nr:ATP-binding protein [Thioflexithrix psekupsensis]OUD13771.1 hypothetical protein TPSD3_05310 [Thioflexithrix psekupsensis]
MTNLIIKKVEIYGLWGRYDIEWNLQADVNILSGINGSGKSTILDLIHNAFDFSKMQIYREKKSLLYSIRAKMEERDGYRETSLFAHVNEIKLSFSDDTIIIYGNNKSNLSSKDISLQYLKFSKIKKNLIRTFDTRLKPIEAVQKLSDDRVKTELDWHIHQLQIKYMDYQLNLSRKKEKLLKSEQEHSSYDDVAEKFQKITFSQEKFLGIIDTLFSETNKKVNRDKNQLEFLLGDKEINAYELSSGEKQLLIILLTVLVQDNQPSLLLMDEPEISLHIDWQENLINYIRGLNPNVQLILATHSPGLIMKGWGDRVFELSHLTVKDRSIS